METCSRTKLIVVGRKIFNEDSGMTRSYVLLTPGPLTTDLAVRRAMLRDWGSRDKSFINLSRDVQSRLSALAQAAASHVCVPLQGSGTFAVEAMISSLMSDQSRSLILVNGAYGRRMAEICRRLGRAFDIYETAEHEPPKAQDIDRILAENSAITHVLMVHCETTSGILNPLSEIAEIVKRHRRELLLDAMSSFGGIEIDLGALGITALAASSNKCLESVPGVSFVLCRHDALEKAQGNSRSLSLDLYDQWCGFKNNGQWRFTPPVQVIAALSKALDLLDAEGGVATRHARFRQNTDILINGMRALGFSTFLDDPLQSPIIVTFRPLPHPNFDARIFTQGLERRGFIIYPGKLTTEESFRIGCIGNITPSTMARVIAAAKSTLKDDMGIVGSSTSSV